MRHMGTHARRRMDERYRRLGPLSEMGRPHRGWIRAVRDALGMSTTELARRLGVSQQRVTALEQGELRLSIQLNTLKRVANALDCELVYAQVPKSFHTNRERLALASRVAPAGTPLAVPFLNLAGRQ